MPEGKGVPRRFLLSAACSAFSIAAVLMTNCTEAIAGMLIDEFTNKDGHDPEQAVEYISHILKSSLPGVLTKRLAKNKSPPQRTIDNNKALDFRVKSVSRKNKALKR